MPKIRCLLAALMFAFHSLRFFRILQLTLSTLILLGAKISHTKPYFVKIQSRFFFHQKASNDIAKAPGIITRCKIH